MKALKFIGVALLMLGVAFLAIGIFAPSFEYEHRVQINAPVEHSWAVFRDSGNMEKWVVGLKSKERLSGKDNEVGSTYRLVFEENGRVIEVVEKVTAIQENEFIASTFEAAPLVSKMEVHFGQVENGTEIVAVKLVQGKNLFWRSLFWLSKPLMMKRGNEIYGNLKRFVEETPMSAPQELTMKH